MLAHARAQFADGRAQPMAQAIDLDLGDGMHLTGSVDRVFYSATGGLVLFDARLSGAAGLREMLAFYIDWAALRLMHVKNLDGALCEYKANGEVTSPKLLDAVINQSDDQLRSGLRRLIDMSLATDTSPLLFFPKTALAYASGSAEDRRARAMSAWEGSEYGGIGERDYAPGYAALLSRGIDLFDERGAAYHAFVRATEQVCDVLDPMHSQLLKATIDATVDADGASA
jgi:exodeoxyribonuclease V gamma subunit